MKTYRIPVVWQMYGHIEVEAETLSDACSIVEHPETPLPEGDYLEGSFMIDEDVYNNYPEE